MTAGQPQGLQRTLPGARRISFADESGCDRCGRCCFWNESDKVVQQARDWLRWRRSHPRLSGYEPGALLSELHRGKRKIPHGVNRAGLCLSAAIPAQAGDIRVFAHEMYHSMPRCATYLALFLFHRMNLGALRPIRAEQLCLAPMGTRTTTG